MASTGGKAWYDVALVSCVAGVSFLNSFFNGALTASLPTIQKDLKISQVNLAWSVTLYSVVFGAFLLPFGRLADVYTARLLFLIGTAIFCILSICISVSPDWQSFTAFATLLALGAAANTPAGVGVLGSHFEEGEAKNRAFSVLGAGQPMGFITGLVLGALLTESKPGWRASFYVQGALSAFFAVIGYFTIPAKFVVHSASIPLQPIASDIAGDSTQSFTTIVEPVENLRVDWIGIALSVLGLVLLTFALADAPSEPRGWRTPYLPPLIPIALALLVAFFYWQKYLEKKLKEYDERRREGTTDDSRPPPPPLLSTRIWKAPYLGTILSIVFMAWSSFNTSSYYINLMQALHLIPTIQSVLEKTPIQTALYFLPMVICGTALNVVPGFLIGRINGKTLIVFSMVMSLIGPLLIAFMDTKAPYWQFLFPIMIFLPAPDMMYAISAVQISRSVSRKEQATAGALFSVVTRLATAGSLGVISTITNSFSTSYLSSHPLAADLSPNTSESPDVLMAGYRVGGGIACAVLTAAGLIIAVIGLRGMGIVGRKEEPAIEAEVVGLDESRLTRRRTAASSTTTNQ